MIWHPINHVGVCAAIWRYLSVDCIRGEVFTDDGRVTTFDILRVEDGWRYSYEGHARSGYFAETLDHAKGGCRSIATSPSAFLNQDEVE